MGFKHGVVAAGHLPRNEKTSTEIAPTQPWILDHAFADFRVTRVQAGKATPERLWFVSPEYDPAGLTAESEIARRSTGFCGASMDDAGTRLAPGGLSRRLRRRRM
jgi:hypothetical protein